MVATLIITLLVFTEFVKKTYTYKNINNNFDVLCGYHSILELANFCKVDKLPTAKLPKAQTTF
jgi:hypothetical protein